MALGEKKQYHSFEKFKMGKILHWYIFSMIVESKFGVCKHNESESVSVFTYTVQFVSVSWSVL